MSKHDIAAFPGGANQVFTDRQQGEPTQYGMTLRDYFAAAALQGWSANTELDQDSKTMAKVRAEEAYAFADAMLAERDK